MLADKVTVWKLTTVMHVLLLTSLLLFVFCAVTDDAVYSVGTHEPASMMIGFVAVCISTGLIFGLNQALLGKSIQKFQLSRGVFLGVAAFFSSLGNLLIDIVGGRLYNGNKLSPFYICITAEAIYLFLTISFALGGRLRDDHVRRRD